ncbi:hypothetical protein FDECE_7022 [Fusarium decemcellulare]|nr:hypothetical protein FDECE_7022 [Fusarium decemcellulare]
MGNKPRRSRARRVLRGLEWVCGRNKREKSRASQEKRGRGTTGYARQEDESMARTGRVVERRDGGACQRRSLRDRHKRTDRTGPSADDPSMGERDTNEQGSVMLVGYPANSSHWPRRAAAHEPEQFRDALLESQDDRWKPVRIALIRRHRNKTDEASQPAIIVGLDMGVVGAWTWRRGKVQRQPQQPTNGETKCCGSTRREAGPSHPGVKAPHWTMPSSRQTFHDALLQGSRRPMQAADWWHEAPLQGLQGIADRHRAVSQGLWL